MELKQLRSYVAVVEEKSFTKAAEKLFTSQPTISTHVRTLEEEFGARLIIRSTKSLEVSPKGQELYEYALQMIQQFDRFKQKWDEKDGSLIEIGSSSIPSAYLLPEILSGYKKENEAILFNVTQSDTSEIIEAVVRNKVSVGFVGRPVEEEKLMCECFYHDKMVVITPNTPDYAKLKNLNRDFFLKNPIILREEGSASQESIEQYFNQFKFNAEAGEGLHIVAKLNDQESIKNHVRHGLGISIVAETAVKDPIDRKDLLVFDLPEKSIEREYYIIYQKDNFLTEQLTNFIDYAKQFKNN